MSERRVADARFGILVRHRADVVAVLVLVAAAVAFLSPALVDGFSFGPFDYATTLTSLGSGLYSHIHNSSNGDAISQMISWNALDWRSIHSGHFPLWNQYSGLGMPEFLNFESSVLSLPDLVSYLVPFRAALFLVAVLVKFVIAGTGAYVFARVIRLRIPAALFAGVTFMFSGAFANWVTWPLSDVVAWSGWIAALAIVVYRKPNKRWMVALAIAVAFAIFGGFPEADVMLVLVLGALFAAAAAAAWWCGRRPSVSGTLRLLVGLVAGVALSAPLWLPGLQVISGSHRTNEGGYPGLPMKSLPLLFSQGLLGEPFPGPTHFGLKYYNYYEATTYLGVPALALALVALLGGRRKPIVIGLGVALFVAFIASYDPVGLGFFFRIVNHIPLLREIRFERTKAVGGFVVAALGAIGFDDCWTVVADRKVLRRQWIGFGVIAVIVVAVAIRTLGTITITLAPAKIPHARALIAPGLLVALLLVVGAVAAMARRQSPLLASRIRQGGMIAVLVGQGAFVFFAGVGIPTYSRAFYPSTPSETRLASIVGDALVGLDAGNTAGVSDFGHVGLYPEVNIGYQIRLFAIHDPLLPTAYFRSWPYPAAAAKTNGPGLFVPDVDSATIARQFGISYILASASLPTPAGTHRVTELAQGTSAPEVLYSVPSAATFSFVESSSGRVTAVKGSATGGFTISTSSDATATLVLRVTAEPGWHVTIDGRPAPIATYDDVMESVVVPAGRHTVVLSYFPRRLKIGIGIALAAVLVALAYALFAATRRRRSIEGADSPPMPGWFTEASKSRPPTE